MTRTPSKALQHLTILVLFAAATHLHAQHAAKAPGWVDPPTNIDFVDYAMQWSHAEESLVDLSGYLEAPAGKHGFINSRDGHLWRPDGKRFRIWGINFAADDCFPPKEIAPRIAADLARLGFNYIRMHHLDAGFGPPNLFLEQKQDTRTLDPDRLDRLDYFIAQLKQQGIYTNLNLNNSRKYRSGDGVRDRRPLETAKCATYFNPHLIELQHEYARNLLDRVNPYTGNHYRDESALVAVEMVNENALFEGWLMERIHGPNLAGQAMFGSLPKSYAVELTVLFNQWLAENRHEPVVESLRKESGTKLGELIPRLRPAEFKSASKERFVAETEFYVSLENRFFTDFKQLLRKQIGLQCLLVGPADHNDGIATFPHIKTLAKHFDFIDGHGYWEHPLLETPKWVRNTPMVNDPLDSSYNQFARTPVLGVPFVFGETSAPYPGDYGAEVFPILAAYACHQDWDGACWFYYGEGRKSGDNPAIDDVFALGNDPARMASIVAASQLFHRADVAVAKKTIVRGYDEETTIESMRWERKPNRPFFHQDYDLSTALRHAVRLTFDPSQATPLPHWDDTGDYTTDTQEISWTGVTKKRGLVAINTPKTQALIGFLNDTAHNLPHLDAALKNPFATIVLTSLDNKTIARSHKMLLVIANRSQNTGLKFKPDHQTVTSLGSAPTQIERIEGTITITGLQQAKTLSITPLGAAGNPIAPPFLAKINNGTATIPLGTPPALWYQITK